MYISSKIELIIGNIQTKENKIRAEFDIHCLIFCYNSKKIDLFTLFILWIDN